MHLFETDSLGAGNMFMTCEDQKKLEFFEKHTGHKSLQPGAQMLFRHKRKKMATVSILLNFSANYSCVILGMTVFHLWVRLEVGVEAYLYCTVTETFAIGFQNSIDQETVSFGGFC